MEQREIKFKYIYSNDKRIITKVFTLEEISNGDCYDYLSDQPLLKYFKLINRVEYTGLKDKNGKEIYEFDWCRACFRDKNGFHYKQGVIKMDEYMWCLDTLDETDEYRIYSINRLHDFEALSNVFENPELLK